MNKLKSISILLSMVLFLNVVLLPISSYANAEEIIFAEETIGDIGDLGNPVNPIATVIFENENESKYTVSTNDYVYHDKYVDVDGNKIIQTTTYTHDEKNVIDYYEHEEFTGSLDSLDSSTYCGPPCGFFAVIVARSLVNGVAQYTLRKSLSSAVLKTIKDQPKSRLDAVIAKYPQYNFTAGGHSFHINKNRMDHFLKRHHSNYFSAKDSKDGQKQDFFIDEINPSILNYIASKATTKNVNTIMSSNKSFVQVEYAYNGINYVVGVDKSFTPYLVSQIYPKTTFLR